MQLGPQSAPQAVCRIVHRRAEYVPHHLAVLAAIEAKYITGQSQAEAMKKLTPAEIDAALEKLDGWSLRDGKLYKKYEFASFNEAFGFMARASMEIEKMNHHPEWSNVYNSIVVNLVTHDAGGVTGNDTTLAGILDSLR